MARNTNATANVTVMLNGESAAAMLKELTDRTEALRRRMTDAYKAGNTAFGDQMKKQLKENERLLRGITTTTYDYSKVLKNINGSTLRDLEKAKRALRAQLQGLVQGTKEFVEKSKQLQQVNTQISRINAGLREQQSGWSRLANGFNKYLGLVSGIMAAFAGVQFGLKKAKEEAAKMDDAYADVMKTTGMTKDEVLQLNEAFKKMNTRTGREELNMLARDAGKLGVAKKDVQGFVEAGNMINVALGEDLGDDAIKNIGKIISVFEKAQKDLQKMDLKAQMLAVGSAINTLGQSSTASEPFMVEFAQRMGGVAAQAGISIQNILGFASALDQSGQAVEMSATSLQKFIMKLMEDPAKFARIAGLEVKQFTQLLATDTNAAIKTVLAALGEKGGFQQLIPIFKDMKLDGARAVGTLSALATNLKAVEEAQVISNQSFAEAISLTNEYNIKNDTLQAKLDKARQRMADLSEELGRKFQGTMFSAIKLWNNLLALIIHMPKEVYILIGVVAAYTIAVNAATVAKKAWIGVIKIWNVLAHTGRAFTLLWIASINTFTGSTTRAAAAWKMFNAAFSKTAIGAVITAVLALGIALYKLVTSTSEATKAYKEFQTEFMKEKMNVDGLFESLKKTNEGTDERRKLIDKINEKYGEYLGYQLSEKANLDEIAIAQQTVIDKMREAFADRMKEKGREDILNKYTPKMADQRLKLIDKVARLKGEDAATIFVDSLLGKLEKNLPESFSMSSLMDNYFLPGPEAYGALQRYLTAYSSMMDELAELNKKFSGVIIGGTNDQTKQGNNTDNKDKKDGDSTVPPLTDEEIKERLASLERLQSEEKLLLANQRKNNRIDAEAYTKALEDLDIKYYAQKRDLYFKDSEEYIKYQQKITDIQIKRKEKQEKEDADILKKRKDYFAALEKVSADYEKSMADEEEAELIAIRQKYEKAKELAQKANDEKLISDIKYLDNVTSLTIQMQNELDEKEKEQRKKREEKKRKAEEDFAKEQLEARKKYELMSLEELKQEELRNLEELNKQKLDAQGKLIRDKLITDEEYQQALLNLNERYNDQQAEQDEKAFDKRTKALRKALAQAATITKVGSNAVSALQDAETAHVEANKEKELSALLQQKEQGLITEEQYNTQKQQIEDNAARERIEIQAKYADANFALQASQAVITGIISAMEAYKALAGIPYVGPALGAAAAAVVAITTAAQIAQLNAEREKAKSISYDGGGGGSSSASQRVVLPGREEGGYVDAEREQDGRRFRARRRRRRGYVEEPTILTGEAGPEFVANNDALANPTIRPVLDIIDIAQRNGSISSINLPKLLRTSGYEKGGYTGTQGTSSATVIASETKQLSTTDKAITAILTETRDLLRDLKSNGVKAPVVITELEKKQALLAKSRALGSRT